MKKSEAIHAIDSVINNYSARSSYEVAAEVLRVVQAIGMKPPLTAKKKDYGTHPIFPGTGLSSIANVNEWDDE